MRAVETCRRCRRLTSNSLLAKDPTVNTLHRLAIVLLASTLIFACGDQEDDLGGNNVSLSDTGNNDPDTDFDVGPDAGPDADPEPDAGDDDPGSSCGIPTDLGSLGAGQEHRFDATLVAPSTSLDSTCDVGSVDTGVHVFTFETDTDARVSLWTSLSPSRLDLRRGGCTSPDDVLTCTGGGTYNFNTSAGQTHHLAVWGDFNHGDFELRLEVTEAVCNPDEPDWCEDGQIKECRQGTSIDTNDCLDECSGDAACGADSCASAITVDMSATSEQTFSGDQHAYTSTWNASGRSDCGTSPGSPGSDTSNEEVFLEVTGLSAGDELIVESLGSGDFVFFVLDDCSADSCLFASDGDSGDERLVWQVPAAGTYIVVVESWQRRSRPIEFKISVQ